MGAETGAFNAAQVRVLEDVAKGAPLHDVLASIVMLVEACAEGMLCSILLYDDAHRCLRHGAAPRLPAEYTRALDGAPIGPTAGSCGAAAFLRERVIVDDIATHPNWTSYRHLALPHGLVASWSTPILSSERALLGTFAMYYLERRGPTAEEITWVATATHLAAIAIVRDSAEQSLRRSEALLRIAGRAARLGGFSLEIPSFRFTWSDELCAIHDLPAGRSPSFEEALAFARPEYRDALRDVFEACARHGTPFDRELEIDTAAKRRVWVRAIGHAERDANGAVTHIQGAIQDIDERRRLELELRQSQKMEAVGQLASGVAHDFNNILSVILSYSTFIVDSLPAGSALRNDVEEIKLAGRRAADLTRQLLTFCRQQVVQLRVVDMVEIVAEMERMLVRLIGEDVSLSRRDDAPTGRVFADPSQIEQVVLNLVVNARDAMPRGGTLTLATGRVSLDAGSAAPLGVAPGPYVTLTVVDTGEGMDSATRARVFEPFFTTKEKGKGSGLGLSTVYGIVTQSGGTISVRSEPGAGATFVAYFPGVDEGRTGAAADRPSASSPRSAPPRGSETVLVVEDVEQVRAVVRSVLGRSGYTVLEAQNAGEALLICEKHDGAVDLLLTDVVLPRLSGGELAARLRTVKPDMRVLYMSGHAGDTIVQYGVSDQGLTFLPKPLTPEPLLRRVREVLDAEPAPAERPPPEDKSEHILHVDDEESLVHLTTRILQRLGYRVTGFTDPVRALQRFRQQPADFDAVVTDVSMHGMDGFELIRGVWHIRADVPVVLTSGHFRPEDLRAAQDLHIRALVVKPDTVEELGRVLHEQLSRRDGAAASH